MHILKYLKKCNNMCADNPKERMLCALARGAHIPIRPYQFVSLFAGKCGKIKCDVFYKLYKTCSRAHITKVAFAAEISPYINKINGFYNLDSIIL